MYPDDYLAWIIPSAQRVCAKYGLPYGVVVAQGAIESQWGTYRIGEFNIFGRKWGGWGNYIEQETQEFLDGYWQTIIAKFQDYESMDQAIEDWCILITQEPVYAPCLQYLDNVEMFVRTLGSIYATDPAYADKVLQTMYACDLA
jgi:flagellum-specific peptidoglycan hydrolase FlgJ